MDVIKYDLGLMVEPNISDEARRINGRTVNAILEYSAFTGKRFEPPPYFEYIGTLRGFNGGYLGGLGNLGERDGGTFRGSEMVCFNDTELAVNMQGSGGAVNNRVQCRWSGVVIRHGKPGANLCTGIAAAYNMRGEPFLDGVTLRGFGDHGLWFSGPNWQAGTRHLRVENCGNVVPGSSGIGKDPKVDCSEWNDMCLENTTVEACGNDDSEAGGIDIPTLTANRGLLFGLRLLMQSNFGKRELRVTNMDAVYVDYLYAEHLCNPKHPVLAEFVNCTGMVRGGYATIDVRVRKGASIRKGSKIISGIDTAGLYNGMEVEGPMIGNTPPPRIISITPSGFEMDQPALGDWVNAETRMRLMDTSGIVLTGSPRMIVDEAFVFGPRSWGRDIVRQ